MNFFVFSFFLFYFIENYKSVIIQREHVRDKFEYWQNVVDKHSNYVDAYYQVSYFALKLGQKGKALEYVDRALVLDPGFGEAEELRKVILDLR
ncbi:hypothetical protein C4577_00075 [Candidatus Parcubacteria bacterium]|nr:MAG: hypothetical protein C4577_00075 [Candidatus Parcubacteria bacterium]